MLNFSSSIMRQRAGKQRVHGLCRQLRQKGKRSVCGFVLNKQKLPSTNAPTPIRYQIHLFMLWIWICHAHTSPGIVTFSVTFCLHKIQIGQSGQHFSQRDRTWEMPKPVCQSAVTGRFLLQEGTPGHLFISYEPGLMSLLLSYSISQRIRAQTTSPGHNSNSELKVYSLLNMYFS